MKPLVLEYPIARDQWVTGLMAVLARYSANDPYRSHMVVARLAGLVLLVLAWQIAGWSAWSLLAACVLLPLGEAIIQRTIGRKAIGSTFDPGESPVWLEISDDGLQERTPNRERRYPWSGVRGAYETGGVIVFDLAGTDILVIPGEALAAPRRAELEAGLAEQGRPLTRRSVLDAQSGTGLPEVATTAKIAVAVAILGIAVGWATSGPVVAASAPNAIVRNLLLSLAAGVAAAVVGWIAAGALLRAALRRSETAATALGWALFGLSLIAFLYGFVWR